MDAETYLRGCFRPELLSAKCYTPPSISCRVNLNQNESPWDVEEDVKREVVERVLARDWRRYPSGTTDALREAIARSLNVAPENILMGNGSNELICALISAVSDEDCTIATLRPTFGLYSHYAAVFGTNLAETKLNADLSFPVDALVTPGFQKQNATYDPVQPEQSYGQRDLSAGHRKDRTGRGQFRATG